MENLRRNCCYLQHTCKVFAYLSERSLVLRDEHLLPSFRLLQYRKMTRHRRVQDRSKLKRNQSLEIVTERCKNVGKVLFLMDVLKKENEMIIPVRNLEHYRSQINLPKPHRITDFIRKSPKLFELYRDQKGVLWCGLTEEAEVLLEEERRLIEENGDKVAEYVTRMLMMSVDRRLRLDKIAVFRRDFGLPIDFRKTWVYKYPQYFRVVKVKSAEYGEGEDYLELVDWNPNWAITELEKKAAMESATDLTVNDQGLLSLPFPLKFPENYKKVYRHGGKLAHFQNLSYVSPYGDASELEKGTKEFDKRAVAVMHELISFTLEKRLATTEHLTHFRREFVMPQKLMRLLLKHFGIFYVSERGKRFSVFLTEAYQGSELIKKCPLVLWKEKVMDLVGYRGRKKRIPAFSDLSDMEDTDLFGSVSKDENVELQPEERGVIGGLEDDSLIDDDEMETWELSRTYGDADMAQ
ncbi:protein WHAT'S THIS FACTOR 1 homolog, chloroplastic-like [Rutidosis leptorrhynchoides]|uniref:protein WHAT'S THIS FACTOR 1 homolog, chloroplastic-like n=1 Tax=Rutidosis leptorrhynchoides TaxID=125765 RepID=UPI003A99140F